MKGQWIRTDLFYQELLATPSAEGRTRLFQEQLAPPCMAIRGLYGGGAMPDDPLAIARTFGWLTPDRMTEEPDALRRLLEANAWARAAEALAQGIARFAPHVDQIPVESVTGWLILADPAVPMPGGRGYTGLQVPGHIVAIFDTPNDYNLPRLPGLVVHELHHIVRLSRFPWSLTETSVADYIVLEGMAEAFAASLFGPEIIGYYVTDLNEEELATAKQIVSEGLGRAGFDLIRGYIFGDHLADRFGFQKVGMPPYGGYAIGYHVVQAYLERTGRSIEEATFLPSEQIIQESAFFA